MTVEPAAAGCAGRGRPATPVRGASAPPRSATAPSRTRAREPSSVDVAAEQPAPDQLAQRLEQPGRRSLLAPATLVATGVRQHPLGGRGQRGQVGAAGLAGRASARRGSVVAGRGPLVVGEQGVVADPVGKAPSIMPTTKMTSRSRPTTDSTGPTSTPWPNRLVRGAGAESSDSRARRKVASSGPGSTWSRMLSRASRSTTSVRAWASSSGHHVGGTQVAAQEAGRPTATTPPRWWGPRTGPAGRPTRPGRPGGHRSGRARAGSGRGGGRRRRRGDRRARPGGGGAARRGPRARPTAGRGGRARPRPRPSPRARRDSSSHRVAGTVAGAPAVQADRARPASQATTSSRRQSWSGRASAPSRVRPATVALRGRTPGPLVGIPAWANDSCRMRGYGSRPPCTTAIRSRGMPRAMVVHDAAHGQQHLAVGAGGADHPGGRQPRPRRPGPGPAPARGQLAGQGHGGLVGDGIAGGAQQDHDGDAPGPGARRRRRWAATDHGRQVDHHPGGRRSQAPGGASGIDGRLRPRRPGRTSRPAGGAPRPPRRPPPPGGARGGASRSSTSGPQPSRSRNGRGHGALGGRVDAGRAQRAARRRPARRAPRHGSPRVRAGWRPAGRQARTHRSGRPAGPGSRSSR